MIKLLNLNIQLFASSTKSVSLTSSSGNRATLTASLTEKPITETNTSNNTSFVDCSASIKMVTGSFSKISSPYLYLYWHDNKTNEDIEVAKKNVTAISKGSTVTISDTIEVEHNDDGSLKGYVKAKWVYELNNQYTPKSGEVKTEEVELTTIPRASKITATTANVEEATTININKAVENFTTTLKYKFDDLEEIIVEKTPLGSYGWIIPSTFYEKMKDKLSEECTIIAITYNGEENLGQQETTFNVTINQEKNKPNIEINNIIDVNPKTIELTGNSEKLIKFLSNAKISISKSAKNYASLEEVNVNGINLNLDDNEVIIENITNNEFIATAIDSRNLSNQDKKSKEEALFVDYVPLTLSALFKRKTPTDGKVILTYNGNYFDGNFGAVQNELKMFYSYKIKDSADDFSEWIEINPQIIENENRFAGEIELNETFDYENVYSFKLSINDKISNVDKSSTYNQDVGRGKPGHWWNKKAFYINKDLYVNDKKIVSYEIPVGSPFFTTIDKNPNEILGYGIWERTSEGTFIVGYKENDKDFGEVLKTGGLKEHLHENGVYAYNNILSISNKNAVMRNPEDAYTVNGATGFTQVGKVEALGYSTGYSSNIPPYLVMYIWLRVE